MHLALNFQRVDPAKGGAETYVADLCRNLVQAGHRVDLYAESWADGALPPQVNAIPVGCARSTRARTPLELRPEFRKSPPPGAATIVRSASSTPGSTT